MWLYMHDRDIPFKSCFGSQAPPPSSLYSMPGGGFAISECGMWMSSCEFRGSRWFPRRGSGSGSGYLLPRCGCVRIGCGFFSEGCTFGAFVFDALTLLVRLFRFRFLCTFCLLFVTLLSPLARFPHNPSSRLCVLSSGFSAFLPSLTPLLRRDFLPHCILHSRSPSESTPQGTNRIE